MSPDSLVRRTVKAAWQEIEDETVLLISAEEKLVGLNPSAGRIWQLADGSRTVAEIARDIAQHFEGESPRILTDTLAFLGMLASRGLVEEAS
jgi:coenzyme PQQ biosynthesis protein PqqD